MAQTGYTPILVYGSATASAVPLAANLTSSANGAELALNYNDGKLYYKDNSGVVQLLASKAGASGSVTSVAMTVPSFLSVSGSPITSSGTLAVSLSGTALPVANGGTGATTLSGVLKGNGASAFTASNVSLSSEVTGTLPVANGGTGQTTYTNGQLLIGNSTGNTLTKATLTAGSGISITNGSGAITIAASASSTLTISNKTSAYTIVSGDNGTIINCTSGTFTVSLTAASSLGSGFNCWIWNTGTGAITIDPNSSETIDGVSTLILRRGEGTQIVCDGTNWQTGDKKTMRAYAENMQSSTVRPIASGTDSIAIGASQATGSGAIAISNSYASGVNSFAAAIGNNASNGAQGYASIAIGEACTASGSYAVSVGASNTASSTNSTTIGYYSTASGAGSLTLGYDNQATGTYAQAFGFSARSNLYGKFAYASGYLVTAGDTQQGVYVLSKAISGATSGTLTTNHASGSTDNQIVLPNNSAFTFSGTVVARRSAALGTQCAGWEIKGLIRREGSAGTTTLIASTVTVISNVPGYSLTLSADTTNGALSIVGSGVAGQDTNWLATVSVSELTFA